MANREKTERRTGTSLLWEPPKSSDSLGSVLLMPVISSQSSSSGSSEGASAFIGQSVGEDLTSRVSVASDIHSSYSNNSAAELPVSVSSSKSQLNQPLRVRQASPSAVQPSVGSSVSNETSQLPGRSSRGSSPMAAHLASGSTTGVALMQQTVPSTVPSPAVSSFVPNIEATSVSSSSSLPAGMTSSSEMQASGYCGKSPLPYLPQTIPSTQGMMHPPYSESYYSSQSLNQLSFQKPLNSGSVFQSKQPSTTLSPSAVSPDFMYVPVEAHWFYRKVIERRDVWFPFSRIDSISLEDTYKQNSENTVVATDGGRYDVIVKERIKKAVYWDEDPLSVRRCTWFYKSDGPQRYSPYEEELSAKLEEYYHMCSSTGRWGQRLEFSGSEIVVMQSPQVIMHYIPSTQVDDWTSIVDHKFKQRVVKRGLDEVMLIEDGESLKVDHLVFVVQGIGSVCDLRFRTVAECVDGFREIANNLVKIHFKTAVDTGRIGRVEFLPVSWHSALHTDDTGVDRRMKHITLPSIPKLRHFTNDTLLDILYYSSPVYCQTILDSVGDQINDLFQRFLSRNPQFTGRVSVAGHSLGSLILFDILANQTSHIEDIKVQNGTEIVPETNSHSEIQDNSVLSEHPETVAEDSGKVSITTVLENLNLLEYMGKFVEEKIDVDVLKTLDEDDIKNLGLPMGPRKKLLTHIKLLNNSSEEKSVVESESNVEIHHTVGTTTLQSSIPLSSSKCDAFCGTFSTQTVTSQYPMSLQRNIYSPIKYPRLVFSPACFFALGSPISMFLTIRGFNSISEDYKLPTCPAFFNIFHPYDPVAFRIETLIDQEFTIKPVVIPHHKGRKRLHLELKEGLSRMGYDLKQKLMESLKYTWNSISEFAKSHSFPTATVEAQVDKIVQEQIGDAYESESTVSASDACRDEDIQIGQLNGGRRIDYVLQEKPIESLNEYLFALTSHATYWDSEDTVLMILKEVYSLEGIFPSSPYKDGGKIHLYNPSLAPLSSAVFQLPNLTASSVPSVSDISSPGQPSKLSVISSSQQMPSLTSQVPLPHITPSASLPQMHTQVPPPPSQPVGPPPLTGFVKRSALAKH